MKPRSGLSGLFSITVTCLCTAVVTPVGADVFRWTDANGVTHFSDEAPEGVVQPVVLQVHEFAKPSDPANDYYSIINQSRRMEESRMAREKLRAEQMAKLEELRIERERIALEAERERYRDYRYPTVGWWGYRPRYHHPYRPSIKRRGLVRRYPKPVVDPYSSGYYARGSTGSRLMPSRGRGLSSRRANRALR